MITPTRPALKFYGAKWQLAKWILPHMPEHHHYVEPCFGSGAVLLQKPRVRIETVGDTNGRIVNYFRMLRDCSEELIRLIELTPWSEFEYHLGMEPSEDPLEDARRFHAFCWMSIRGGPTSPSGFRWEKAHDSRRTQSASDLQNNDLHAVANRFLGVQIMQRDARKTIDAVSDIPGCFIYFDPPYVPGTRRMGAAYGEFEVDEQFHRDAAELLRGCKGLALVSGYACDLYEEIYEDYKWLRKDKVVQTNSGSERVESLWLSPRLQIRLGNAVDLPLWNWQENE